MVSVLAISLGIRRLVFRQEFLAAFSTYFSDV